MPLRIPTCADLPPSLILAHADGGHQIHERRAVGVGHVRPDRSGVVRRIGLIGRKEGPSQFLRVCGCLGRLLEFDVHVRFRALLLRHAAVRSRHAVIEQHHVVLNHAEPARLRVAPGSGGFLLTLQRGALRNVSIGTVQAGLFVVPEDEADGALGLHPRCAQNARQFHDQRGSGAVVVGRLSPAVAVHVRADDIHFIGVHGADFRAIDLFTRARLGRLRIQGAQLLIQLQLGIFIDAGVRLDAPVARATHRQIRVRRDRWTTGSPRLGGGIRVLEPRDIRAAVALELRLDPVAGRAIAIGSLPSVAEFRQTLDGRLESLEIQMPDQYFDRILRPRTALIGGAHCGTWEERRRQHHRRRDRGCTSAHGSSCGFGVVYPLRAIPAGGPGCACAHPGSAEGRSPPIVEAQLVAAPEDVIVVADELRSGA